MANEIWTTKRLHSRFVRSRQYVIVLHGLTVLRKVKEGFFHRARSKRKMVLRNVVRSSEISKTPFAFFTDASERGCFSFGSKMRKGFFRLRLVFMFLPSTVELASLCLFFACFARDTRPKLFVCPKTRLEARETMKKNDILTATYRTYCVAAQCDKLI